MQSFIQGIIIKVSYLFDDCLKGNPHMPKIQDFFGSNIYDGPSDADFKTALFFS